MIVLFRVNLGSTDAKLHELDHLQCTEGKSIECNDVSGKWLVSRGLAVDVTPEPVIPESQAEPVANELEQLRAVPTTDEAIKATASEQGVPEQIEPAPESPKKKK